MNIADFFCVEILIFLRKNTEADITIFILVRYFAKRRGTPNGFGTRVTVGESVHRATSPPTASTLVKNNISFKIILQRF